MLGMLRKLRKIWISGKFGKNILGITTFLPGLPENDIFCLILRHTQNSRPIIDYLYLMLKNRLHQKFHNIFGYVSQNSYTSVTIIHGGVVFPSKNRLITDILLYFTDISVCAFHVYFGVVQSLILITSQNLALYQKIGLKFFSQKIVSDVQGPRKSFLNIKYIA